MNYLAHGFNSFLLFQIRLLKMAANQEADEMAIDEKEFNADPSKFNPYRLLVAFKRCIVKTNCEPVDVLVKDYVSAYSEIIK